MNAMQVPVDFKTTRSSFSRYAGLVTLGAVAITPATSLATQYQPHTEPSRSSWQKSWAANLSSNISTHIAIAETQVDLAGALNRIYERLSANQVDLEPEMASLLYENLWDLYE